MDARTWGLLVAGALAGGCLVWVSAVVRDAVWDAVYAVDAWWWRLVYAVRRALVAVGAVVVTVLVVVGGVAVVVALLPRFVES